ncbi:fasciclin, partial [Brevundimonas sp. AAP58]|uniref:fasciclin domain-containing protein n=1 Tax=Brevundimonas sp. AAP58 TaxID=1523422 RepID=UPI0006CC6154
AADVIALIEAGNGSAAITTVSGDTLTASLRDGSVILTDENGGVATVVQADLMASNGVIHVTNAVSVPQ